MTSVNDIVPHKHWRVVGIKVGAVVVFRCSPARLTWLQWIAPPGPVDMHVKPSGITLSYSDRVAYVLRYTSVFGIVLHRLELTDDVFFMLRHYITRETRESTANVVPQTQNTMLPFALNELVKP